MIRLGVAIGLASAVTLLGAPAARAQATDPTDPLAAPALAAVRVDLRAILTEARAAGLSTDPILDKIREGLAKGAPAERIVAAARRVLDRFAQADRLAA